MMMLAAASGGLRGLVVSTPPLLPPLSCPHLSSPALQVDEGGSAVEGAVVRIEEVEVALATTPRGEWWRLLPPGTYTLSARCLLLLPPLPQE